jgi:hypothetical protein
LILYFRNRVHAPLHSRSRPYQKNDNRFVEQKNRTLVRDFLDDARLDTLTQQVRIA